jgi:hypothetical protein
MVPLLVLVLDPPARPPHPRAAAMANIEIASVGRIIAATLQRKNPAHRKTAK